MTWISYDEWPTSFYDRFTNYETTHTMTLVYEAYSLYSNEDFDSPQVDDEADW